ncbi:PAS domain S-box protein [Massilia sp. IC2-476]|uniref:PAS domain-containing hybrid sensor histidine kinase/response regulator n=1 Tax=Massilia sp. IC2-476 TaxID=2887199 RepID=UPI001D0FC622|nr:PAS domain S-box protein [Massilia sp. IC2-476]MCC2971924.1 PAS domain S-box protein [Massilia sp. IC2-476]
MSYNAPPQAVAEIDDLVVTHELATRPARAPDHAAENRALAALAQDLAQKPDRMPERLEEVLRALCGVEACGVGLPAEADGGVDWHAAGADGVVLMRRPARVFPFLEGAAPPAELLLAACRGEDGAICAIWVASRGDERRLDAEDARLLRSLAPFAAAAQRLACSHGHAGQARREMERDFVRRTDELQATQARLADEAAQRLAAERELRESHAILEAAMHTEAVGLAFYALDGSIIDCNSALERMSGYGREELRSAVRWSDLATPEFTDTTLRALSELRSGGRTAPYIKQLARKDGSRWWAMVAPTCLPGEGDERKCIAFVIDITETRRAEVALQASEERFQALMKGLAQATWETDADGAVRTDSPGWRRMTGQSVEESAGLGWVNAVHPDDRHFVMRHWHEAVAQGSPVNAEFRVRQAGGGWRWTNARAAPLRNPDGSIARWIGMNIDVDARRQAEAALRESDGRFRVLAEASPALIFQLDEQGQVSYANRRSLEVVGMRAGTGPADGWGALLHPDDGPRYIERVRTAIAERAPFQQRVRARAADGGWHWFESHGAPLFGAGNAYRGHVGISIDVTEAVQAEEALRNADRRKDEFLATLAHELRNPLAPISNAVHLLRRPDGRRTADRMVEMVGRQVRQMVRLVDDLMDVSRITQGKLELRREPLSLAEILSMAVETSMPAIEAGRHELTVSLPEETLVLEADKVRLTQVFGNMLNNAAKYTDRGGHIWASAWREDDQVVVSVRDSGIGIPAAKLPHVFEMFSQAHRDSVRGQAGLGIGLTMVRSLVELHGGSVEARSEGPGKGSEFLVRLPLAPVAAPVAHDGLDEGAAPLEGRRVLVVDDNGDAAESLALLLQAAGAEVRTARDGPAGLEAVRQMTPHAVLLDLGMPGMDGFEVARRLRADPANAALVLVALTGWGQAEDRRRTQASGFDHHLTKPVDVDLLLDILGRIRA